MYPINTGDRDQARAILAGELRPARSFVTVAVPQDAAGLCAELAALEPQIAALEARQRSWDFDNMIQAAVETIAQWRWLLLAALSGQMAALPPTCCVCGREIVEHGAREVGTDDAGTLYGPGWAFDLDARQWYHGACADL